MIELRINGLPSFVKEGATVLEAAETVLVDIPTLCHLKGCGPETSCMLCVVKDLKTGQLIPSCSARAVDGMEIDSACDEVQSARRDILNLLLSEHVGDCEAPCTRICPAHLDIPLMLREMERGHIESAGWIAKRDLAIPATLGYVCPAPCEKGCRRGQVDEAITIQALHLEVAGAAAGFSSSTVPARQIKVAVIGAGPAGLSCAWALVQKGYHCTVFDEADKAGGHLRNHRTLPLDVLDAEIDWLVDAGIEFSMGKAISMHDIADRYEGVVFAETEFSGTHFADAFYAEEHTLTVKAVANGKEAAAALDRFLKGEPPSNAKPFDSRVGKLRDSEVRELTKNCSEARDRQDAGGTEAGAEEAARCLHCDCRNPMSCKLRKYADQYGAAQNEFHADERHHLKLIGHEGAVVYEPGKCIRCGLCIKVAERAGEQLGLTFVGRGFNSELAVPFEKALEEGIAVSAADCVKACPTGALAFRDAEEKIV